ncbi:hypothetical protein MKW94_024573 [Papaver nudicaule]|uniref:F-box domain-containing protein n=1 Tax=Papaver nudicaule TaxID=74823 RepID=A0AA41VXW8_PAPNU|nr:hypothetical protein [Papaver nudicaule]
MASVSHADACVSGEEATRTLIKSRSPLFRRFQEEKNTVVSSKRKMNCPPEEEEKNRVASSFPDEVLERVLVFVKSHKDRSSVSLVCKDWYSADRWSRTHVYIENCYSVSPEILIRRFINIKSVTIKGRPRFSDFGLVPLDWGADIGSWLLRIKRMTVTDESLKFLAQYFPHFKALSLQRCDGFSTHGLAAIATHCKNLIELDIQENPDVDDADGTWLSCFPESFTSLEVLNFASLDEVNFDALEGLVARCKALRVLKASRSGSGLTELGVGSFSQELAPQQYEELEIAFSNCKKLNTLSGLWDVSPLHLPFVFPGCTNLTYLNLREAYVRSTSLFYLLISCPNLRRLWVLDSIEDKGLEVIGSRCPLLEELRVFPEELDPLDMEPIGVTEKGLIDVPRGCSNLHYFLFFCRQMTNAALITVAKNNSNFTHFRLCILEPNEPGHVTSQPLDEGIGAIVQACKNLKRLSLSGLLTDQVFLYIGMYGKNLEMLSVASAGESDKGMAYVLNGCMKLSKLEIRDSPFGDSALLAGMGKYETMRSLCMSSCNITLQGCKMLADKMKMLNVEVINEKDRMEEITNDKLVENMYLYRTLDGPRKDAPDFVSTL